MTGTDLEAIPPTVGPLGFREKIRKTDTKGLRPSLSSFPVPLGFC